MITTWAERITSGPVKGRVISGIAAAAAIGALFVVTVAGAAGPATASAGQPPAAGPGRGSVVSVTPLRTLPGPAAVRAELAGDRFSTAAVRYGVRTYRLVYRTVSATGQPTTASGLLAVPVHRSRRLTAVSFAHGTEVFRGDAPSMQPSGFDPAPGYTFASAGFAAALPDYLGLGTGPGTHPWMDVPSETTASLDLLRAARSYLARQGLALRRQVLVTGFSQGASAALGLGRALQDGADRWFRLGALAPISGPYDFRHAELPALLDGALVRLNPSPATGAKYAVLYTAYTMVAFNRLHPFYASPAQVFKSPYAATITPLFDSNHTGQQVLAGTPGTLGALLTGRGFALLRHPSGGLATELTTADSVCDWHPAVPTRLYLATRDEQAVNANTWHCQADFAARHSRVPVIDLGTPDYQRSRHLGSAVAGTAAIVRWFERISHSASPGGNPRNPR
jgi:hypothetical protein